MQIEIEDYEDVATGELLSLPELQLSLLSRDALYTASLEPAVRQKVEKLDEQLLRRSAEVRTFLSSYGSPDVIFSEHPPQRWWWHLPRIATGRMQVNLKERTVNFEGKTYTY
ncbi:hypothetical protein [Paenibacillus sp. PL2-23]|uniref:hypothetical protein n=1 Tax=Paenibacillus sp. PL2-23 TaxID=2100729 RepID=UPI0030F5BAF6